MTLLPSAKSAGLLLRDRLTHCSEDVRIDLSPLVQLDS